MISFMLFAALAVAGVAFVMVGIPTILFTWSRAIAAGWHCGVTHYKLKELDYVKAAERKEAARRN